MRVVALNGSPRLIGNTSAAVNVVLDELEKEGIEVEHVQLYEGNVIPCNDCGSCGIRGDGRCINENDSVNGYIEKILRADGVILASPTYYGSVTAHMKMILERIGLCSATASKGNGLRRKVGAAVAVQGHHGGDAAYSEMVNFMLENGMVVCSPPSRTVLTGEKPSAVLEDGPGMKALRDLGKEMSWLLFRLKK